MKIYLEVNITFNNEDIFGENQLQFLVGLIFNCFQTDVKHF